MSELTPHLQTIATTCGLCHDQCVSSCPVVESSQNLTAYPSRLAALAWELSTGRLEPGSDEWQALAHCIHCNACTQNCVYIDQPVDVTPLVRWGRQVLVERDQTSPQMRAVLETIRRHGNPYGDIRHALKELQDEFPGSLGPGATLVIVDAAQLALDLPSAKAGLRLLERLGCAGIRVADLTYTGWELWQYGCRSNALEIARAVQREVERVKPEAVVALSPSNAYLLRDIYPHEMGISIQAQVMALAEAVLARIDSIPPHRPTVETVPVFLVPSFTELNQLHSPASREVLVHFGIEQTALPSRQPYRPPAYPEGLCIDLDPQPGHLIANRIARMVDSADPCLVLGTTAFSLQAMRAALPGRTVKDWSEFVFDHLNS
jgi:heterodisulfide reductase subunit C